MTIADAIVLELRQAGVRALFGVPGGAGNLDLIDAARRQGLPFVLTATETAGAIAALAQAELTGHPGACLSTLGPGAASIVNGVACAALERAPLVVFTDGHAGGAESPFEHQRLDHAALFAPIAKASMRLTAENAPAVVREALRVSAAGRPGPVHVDCPGSVVAEELAARPETATAAGRSRPAEAGPYDSAYVGSARKPLLLIGLGARRADDANAIRSLCRERRIPALVTYKAKGVVPDDDPWFGGVFTNAAIERPLLDESDLLIGVGLDPVELLARPWTGRAPVVSLGRWPVDARQIPFAEQHLTADLAGAMRELASQLGPTDWAPGAVRAHAAGQRAAVEARGSGLSPSRAVQVAAGRLASTRRLTVDAGAHMFPATMLWPVSEPNDLLISNGLSTMGFAVPAAIGAARLDRTRPVVALTGDGGLLMCAGELLTAARERLNVIVLVMNDASLSLIEVKQRRRGLAAAGVALGAVDWRAVAEGLGVSALAAATPPELEAAIDRAVAHGGPVLIDVHVDGAPYGDLLEAVRG